MPSRLSFIFNCGLKLHKFRTFFIATGIVLTLSTSTIFTPLWLDSIPGSTSTNSSDCNHTSTSNDSNASCIPPKTPDFHRVDSFSIIFIVNALYVIFSGTLLLSCNVFCQSQLSGYEKNFSKLNFFWIGFSDALSSICFVYAASGTRTAPYLQSLAVNFAIPVTFITRYLILQKKPTRRKTFFAALVLVAEFIALIPSIFPSLESSTTKQEDGGASGVAGFLWPLCYFLGFIPQAIVIVVLEKASQSNLHTGTGTSRDVNSAHPLYVLFWSYLFCGISICCLFWTDLIPKFGNTSSFTEFWSVFAFNIKCFIGVADCSSDVHVFSILCTLAMLINRIFYILFLKYSEGANYLIIITSLQTPVVFLFWTLFDEKPFQWHPHAHLSTWLSIVAVSIMLPAIYFYSMGPSDTSSKPQTVDIQEYNDVATRREKRPLFDPTESYESPEEIPSTNRFLHSDESFQQIGSTLYGSYSMSGSFD